MRRRACCQRGAGEVLESFPGDVVSNAMWKARPVSRIAARDANAKRGKLTLQCERHFNKTRARYMLSYCGCILPALPGIWNHSLLRRIHRMRPCTWHFVAINHFANRFGKTSVPAQVAADRQVKLRYAIRLPTLLNLI